MGQLRAQDYAAVRDWPAYYAKMAGKPVRETLLEALAGFEKEGAAGGAAGMNARPRRAVDLGCGEGRETVELLSRGWEVVAVDDCPAAFEVLMPRVAGEERARLTTHVCGFSAVPWETIGEVDLVNASYALPFCPSDEFSAVWAGLVRAIRCGGRFAGQFFGDRDDWAALPDRTHHTRNKVERLLEGFVLESFREVENDEPSGDPARPSKHWHLFHVVAKKR